MPQKAISKSIIEVRSMARGLTGLAINTLAGVARSKGAPAAARVAASVALLDRGWGRTHAEHGDEGGTSIRVTIRQIIQAQQPLSEPGKVIEHDAEEQPLNYGIDQLD